MNSSTLMIARQAIFGGNGKLYGYELLYRGPSQEAAGQGTMQTARVLSEAIGNIGIERIVGDRYMFVNFDQELLESDFASILPFGLGVAEILPSVEPSARVFKTLARLRESGICIALDGFRFQANLEPLLKFADYIKVDVLAEHSTLEEISKRLAKLNKTLVALKVETRDQQVRCEKLGFKLFQGFYFAKPETMKSTPVGVSQLGILALVGELQSPDSEPAQFAGKISCDVGLAHYILKLANSAAFRRQRAVSSILDAVILLGQDIVRQWASMLLVTRLNENKPPELLSLALIRGRLCQRIGAMRKGLKQEELFLVGLLSVLDALLDRPMSALVGELPLSMAIREALCGSGVSALGDVLQQCIAYERGDWGALVAWSESDKAEVSAAYASAVQFAQASLGT